MIINSVMIGPSMLQRLVWFIEMNVASGCGNVHKIRFSKKNDRNRDFTSDWRLIEIDGQQFEY